MIEVHWKGKIQECFQNKRKRRDREVPDVSDRISDRKTAKEGMCEYRLTNIYQNSLLRLFPNSKAVKR